MRAPEWLETERLILRRPRPDDAEGIFTRYARDPDVVRYLSWPKHESLEATRAFLRFSDEEWKRAPAGPYLLETRGERRLIGSSGLSFERPFRAATGYVLAKDAWGRGYATEALRAMADLAHRLGVVRLYALCHVEHLASARVLEKGGFTREGVLRRQEELPNFAPGEPCDMLCYARILREPGR